MAVSSRHKGWSWDRQNARLDFYYEGTRIGHINTSGMDLATGLTVQNAFGVLIGHTVQATTAQVSELQVLGTTSTDASLVVGCWNVSATVPPIISFIKSREAAIIGGTPVKVESADNLGAIIWYADDGGDTVTPAASIKAEVNGTTGANDMPGRLVFSTTADGGNTVIEALRLGSDQCARFMERIGFLGTAASANKGIYSDYDELSVAVSKIGINIVVNGAAAAATALYIAGAAFIGAIDATNAVDWTSGFALVGAEGDIEVETGATGTITGGASLVADAIIAAATVTNRYGLYVKNGSGAGAITNQYGVYIADQTKGATADYGLYIGGADTYAIWVDADDVRLDGNLLLNTSGATISSATRVNLSMSDTASTACRVRFGDKAGVPDAADYNWDPAAGSGMEGFVYDTTNGRLCWFGNGGAHYVAQTAGFAIPVEEIDCPKCGKSIKVGDQVGQFMDKVQSDGALHGLYAHFGCL